MNTASIQQRSLIITLEDNAILPDLKKALKLIKGISSVRVAKADDFTRFNATTLKAIDDVKKGRTYKASSVDDLLDQCLE